jgi:hypothetical protein
MARYYTIWHPPVRVAEAIVRLEEEEHLARHTIEHLGNVHGILLGVTLSRRNADTHRMHAQ